MATAWGKISSTLKQPGATEAWDLAVVDGYLLCTSYDVNLFQPLPFSFSPRFAPLPSLLFT